MIKMINQVVRSGHWRLIASTNIMIQRIKKAKPMIMKMIQKINNPMPKPAAAASDTPES